MDLFDVYPLWLLNLSKHPVAGFMTRMVKIYRPLRGHAVISIGHCHPTYCKMLTEQLHKIGFYSNAVQNSFKRACAGTGKMSDYEDYSLFLCNSGAEANENAIKLASFQTGKAKILALHKAFHGRTSGAVAATDNPVIQAPFNRTGNVTFIPMGDLAAAESEMAKGEYAAILIEGIQGVAGIFKPKKEYLEGIRELCDRYRVVLIFDEVQSGYGRSGRFFAHQHSEVVGDIITAKGMGNGFPIGGVLISPLFKATHGMLGTTFGGNHLACTAALAVLRVIREEALMENAVAMGDYIIRCLKGNKAIKEIRGKGLMIGIELKEGYETLRNRLLFEKQIFTGGAGKNIIRLLRLLMLINKQLIYL